MSETEANERRKHILVAVPEHDVVALDRMARALDLNRSQLIRACQPLCVLDDVDDPGVTLADAEHFDPAPVSVPRRRDAGCAGIDVRLGS
jgi:hypothetical protein